MAKKSEADSVDANNPGYAGVDDIYKNHAYSQDSPGGGDDIDDVIANQVKFEQETKNTGFLGYSPEGFSTLLCDSKVENTAKDETPKEADTKTEEVDTLNLL